jgi:hypothetical protein
VTIDTINCSEHGPRQEAFICQHIHDAGKQGASPGFNFVPTSDNDFPDAWCDECEAHLQGQGGEWSDETQSFTKIVLLCSGCYDDYRQVATAQGKVRAH